MIYPEAKDPGGRSFHSAAGSVALNRRRDASATAVYSVYSAQHYWNTWLELFANYLFFLWSRSSVGERFRRTAYSGRFVITKEKVGGSNPSGPTMSQST